ncbi:MAG: iron-sulfur cluster-binding protein [Acidobacteria bacterium]|nr:iron-sulfur cluster-binding protein [Acidobacteriota bacterium]
MNVDERPFAQRTAEALADAHLRHTLRTVTTAILGYRRAGLGRLPASDGWRDHARRIRAHTLANLDRYLDQFAGAVEARGGHVHYAATAAEAVAYVRDLAIARGVRLAVKGKSMVTEEIDLNGHLERAGIRVVETDLGEYIVQLADDRPSHIVMPIMHMTRHQVADLFKRKIGATEEDVADIASMTQLARRVLREEFVNADMGISGCNFAVAETGSITTCTNEGNGRLTTTMPRIHVAMMGMERIVPTVADLGVMLQVLARSATGQNLTVYTNVVNGPRPREGDRAEGDGPDEFHVVIVDNGRSRVLASGQAEILYCIRCGACLNTCPVFHQIGGHAYGSVYPGPIGSVLTPAMHGMEKFDDLPQASTLCGACRDVCPVRIDIPRMLLELRAKGVAQGKSPLWVTAGIRAFVFAGVRPGLFRTAGALAARASRMLARGGWIRRLPGHLSAWTRSRDFPALAATSFQERWEDAKTAGVRDNRENPAR